MGIDLPGHRAPSAGFEMPLQMLDNCHRRLERQCATLQRLVPHLAAHGADAEACSAAAAVLRYFDTAAVDHHADEEQDLFPALIESMAASDAVCVREMIAALRAEHRELESRWLALRQTVEAISVGRSAALEASAVEGLIGGYERHLAREDRELLPMAARLLGDADLQRIGRAMRLRRGIGDVE